jgi:hypothetical protein
MDYNTGKVAKIINLYFLLTTNEVSYIRNEVGKFLKNGLLPALGDKDSDGSEIADLTRETSDDCQSCVDNVSLIGGKDKRHEIISSQIASVAGEVSNYQDKPLVVQLACLWYILSSTDNEYKNEVAGLLKENWNIKDDLFAEMVDTAETLTDLKENSQKAVLYTPQNGFSVFVRNLFRKNKIPDRQKAVEYEYRHDKTVLLDSINQLFATEAVKG